MNDFEKLKKLRDLQKQFVNHTDPIEKEFYQSYKKKNHRYFESIIKYFKKKDYGPQENEVLVPISSCESSFSDFNPNHQVKVEEIMEKLVDEGSFILNSASSNLQPPYTLLLVNTPEQTAKYLHKYLNSIHHLPISLQNIKVIQFHQQTSYLIQFPCEKSLSQFLKLQNNKNWSLVFGKDVQVYQAKQQPGIDVVHRGSRRGTYVKKTLCKVFRVHDIQHAELLTTQLKEEGGQVFLQNITGKMWKGNWRMKKFMEDEFLTSKYQNFNQTKIKESKLNQNPIIKNFNQEPKIQIEQQDPIQDLQNQLKNDKTKQENNNYSQINIINSINLDKKNQINILQKPLIEKQTNFSQQLLGNQDQVKYEINFQLKQIENQEKERQLINSKKQIENQEQIKKDNIVQQKLIEQEKQLKLKQQENNLNQFFLNKEKQKNEQNNFEIKIMQSKEINNLTLQNQQIQKTDFKEQFTYSTFKNPLNQQQIQSKPALIVNSVNSLSSITNFQNQKSNGNLINNFISPKSTSSMNGSNISQQQNHNIKQNSLIQLNPNNIQKNNHLQNSNFLNPPQLHLNQNQHITKNTFQKNSILNLGLATIPIPPVPNMNLLSNINVNQPINHLSQIGLPPSQIAQFPKNNNNPSLLSQLNPYFFFAQSFPNQNLVQESSKLDQYVEEYEKKTQEESITDQNIEIHLEDIEEKRQIQIDDNKLAKRRMRLQLLQQEDESNKKIKF